MSNVREKVASVVKEAMRMQGKYDKQQKHDVHAEMKDKSKRRPVSKIGMGTSKPEVQHGPVKCADERGFSDGFVEVLLEMAGQTKQAGMRDMLGGMQQWASDNPMAAGAAMGGLGGLGLGAGGLLAAQRMMGGGQEEPSLEEPEQMSGMGGGMGLPPELMQQLYVDPYISGFGNYSNASFPGVQSNNYMSPSMFGYGY